jgi:oxalyl-CoA decarboxylase
LRELDYDLVADIGLGTTPSPLVENGPALWLERFPWPDAASHKHARGRLAVVSGEQVIAIEGDSAFGFSGMEVETICRYNLPVCIVVFNNNGVYRGTDVNPSGTPDVAPTVFVKGARYDKLMEAFGGTGVHATTPAELRAAMEEAVRSRRPTLINAVIDETAGTESGRITSLNPSAAKKK